VLAPLYATLVVALLFYLIIPMAGAVAVALSWRKFRRRVVEIGQKSVLVYRETVRAFAEAVDGSGSADAGSFRLYGKIEAMEEDQRIWVRGDRVSALVDMSRAPLYVLLPGKPQPGAVRRYSWKSISSLAAGTSVLVSGRLKVERGKPIFVDSPEERLIAVTYDGSDSDLVRRLVIGGRRPNEYWTAFGPVSLAIGMTVSSGLLFLLGSRTPFSTIRALSLLIAVIPVLPLLPPGLGLFLLYRRLWRRALLYRMERDLLRFSETTDEAAGRARSAQRKATTLGLLALTLCALAVAANYVLAFLLWRSVF
jgi:hypothetical protein